MSAPTYRAFNREWRGSAILHFASRAGIKVQSKKDNKAQSLSAQKRAHAARRTDERYGARERIRTVLSVKETSMQSQFPTISKLKERKKKSVGVNACQSKKRKETGKRKEEKRKNRMRYCYARRLLCVQQQAAKAW